MFEHLFLETGFPVHICLLAVILLGIKVLKNEK